MEHLFLERVRAHRDRIDMDMIGFEAFTGSSYFLQYLTDLTRTLSAGRTVPLRLVLSRSEEGKKIPASRTYGKTIYLDTNNLLTRNFSAYQNKVFAILGYLFHELAHVLYFDIKGEFAAMQALKVGRMPFAGDKRDQMESGRIRGEIMAAMKQAEFAALIQKLYSDLANVISDAHDEEKMCRCHSAFVKKSILTLREGLFSNLPSLESLIECGEHTPLTIMTALLLQYARFGSVFVLREETVEASWYIQALGNVQGYLDTAKATDDLAVKYGCINVIVEHLWPFLHMSVALEAEDEQEPSEDSGGDGGGGGEDEGESEEEGGGLGDAGGDDGSEEGGDPGSEGGPEPGGDDGEDDGEQTVQSGGGEDDGTGNKQEAGEEEGGNQNGGGGEGGEASGEDTGGQSGGGDSDEQDGSGGSGAGGGDEDTNAAQSMEKGAGGSGGGGRAGQGLDAVRELMDQLERAMDSCGGESFSSPPENIFRQGADQSEEEADTAQQELSEQGNTQLPEEILQTVMDQIYSDLMQEKAEELAAQDQLNEAISHITTGNMCSPHFGIALELTQVPAGRGDQQAYERIIDANRSYLKKIYKEVQKIIQEEGVTTQRHRYIGRRVDAKSAYKVDQRYFTKKKNPDKLLDMSVVVLVDNSGSMGGKRLTAAKESAMLLAEVLEWLEIPTLIAGYHCDHSLCFHVYKQFEDVKTAKYAVNRMTAEGDNRDGMALGIAANFLAERSEQNKLLVIISDGQPNSSGYGGEPARNDIRAMVRSARRSGIKTLAFAIGEDQSQIKQIYGEAHIDISDVEQLPKTLSKLLEKEILSSISSR